jgi:hypothetical protein
MFSKPSWKVLAGLCSLLGCSAEADKGGPDRAVVPDAAGRPATTAGAGAKSGGGGGGSGGDFAVTSATHRTQARLRPRPAGSQAWA